MKQAYKCVLFFAFRNIIMKRHAHEHVSRIIRDNYIFFFFAIFSTLGFLKICNNVDIYCCLHIMKILKFRIVRAKLFPYRPRIC